MQKMTSWRCLTCWLIKLWRRKMTSLVNKSADWTPNYYKILIFSPPKSLKSLRAARIDQLADSNEPANIEHQSVLQFFMKYHIETSCTCVTKGTVLLPEELKPRLRMTSTSLCLWVASLIFLMKCANSTIGPSFKRYKKQWCWWYV